MDDNDNNISKMKITKLTILKKCKNNFPHKIKNIIEKNNNSSFTAIKLKPKEIKMKNNLFFKDPFKQKILNRIKKSKSRQSIFHKTNYFYYGKDENNIKLNNNLKSTIEMENKFYIRNKKGLKQEFQSDSLIKFLSKDPRMTLKKVNINNGKNKKFKKNITEEDIDIDNYGKKMLKKSKSNYIYLFNEKKINNKLNQTVVVSHNKKCKKMKNNKSFEIPSNISLNKFNLVSNNSFNKNKKKTNFEKKANPNVKIFKKILKNRIKKNSEMLSESMTKLGENCLPYENIKPCISNRKIVQNIYINKANLTRLIKVNKVIREGFYEDDDINCIKKLKNFSKNINYIFKNIKVKYSVPKYIKTNHFSKSTILRFNQHQGNFFGIPV